VNAWVVSLVVLGVVLASAAGGSWLGTRLPAHHRSDASKDLIKVGTGTIATLAALVLGLLVASAKNSYDAKDGEVQQAAAKVIQLDRLLRQYGDEARPARERLRGLIAARHDMQWVSDEALAASAGKVPPNSAAAFYSLRNEIAQLPAPDDAKRSVQSRALQVIDEFTQMRWLFVAQSTEGVNVPLLIVMIFWLATVTFCTSLYAPRNGTIAMVTLLCAASLAASVFLIIEMYQPFDGLVRISDAPLRAAMSYLNEP